MGFIQRFRININSNLFVLLVAAYFGFVFNYPVNSKMIEFSTAHSYFAYSSPFLLSAAFLIIFSFFTIPYLTKPVFIILVFTSALASYATLNYRVMYDYAMIENVIETNTSEASSYLSSSSILYTVIFGFLPCILIALCQFKKPVSWLKHILQRVALVVLGVVVIGVIFVTSYKDYASVGRNHSYLNKMIIPAHIYYTGKYIDKEFFTTPRPYKQIGLDAHKIVSKNSKPELTILILGETARAMNYDANGYNRNTTPYTDKYDPIWFHHVTSCGTATAHSVPCMFSNLPRKHYSREVANSQDNAIDIISRAGVSVLWKENDGGDKGVARHVTKIDIEPKDHPQHCDAEVCRDGVMLENLDEQIAQNAGKDQLLVLHIMGSHGPTYWKRYPADQAVFTPSCDRADIENCSDVEIRNVFDNTLVYTDKVTSELIAKLESYRQHYNVALMYLSDHGESLGENGLYLHGTPYSIAPKEQTHVPWLLWMDNQYAQAYGIDKQCVRQKANEHISQDNLFHTLLDFANVETSVKDDALSLISSCRR